MADFDKQKAVSEQNYILDRVSSVHKTIKNEVVDYYWDREPVDKEGYYEHLKSIHKYLKEADGEMEQILNYLDKILDY